MNQSKKTFVLLGVLILLIGIILSIKWISQKTKSDKTKKSIFPKIKTERISSIVIHSSSNHVVMEKIADSWVVITSDSFPADTNEINKIIGNLNAMNTKTLISSNPAKRNIFQVDDSAGINVKVADRDTIVNVFIGKNAADYNSVYFRTAYSDQVYLFEENIRWNFEKESTRWRDPTLLYFNKENLTNIKLSYADNSTVELEKQSDEKWKILSLQNYGVKQDVINTMLNTLSSLNYKEVEKDKKALKEYGLDKPTCTITVRFKDTTQRFISIGKLVEKDNFLYALRGDRDYIYSIWKYQGDNIMKKIEDLKEEPKPEAAGPVGMNLDTLIQSEEQNPLDAD